MTPLRALPFFLLTIPAPADLVTAPGGLPQTATLTRDGPTTTILLKAASRVEWSRFQLGSKETLRLISEAGGKNASLHRVVGAAPASLDGLVTADGPFYLISPAGIQIGAGGHIQAPRVLLSGLAAAEDNAVLSGEDGAFFPTGPGQVGIQGKITALNGAVFILGTGITAGPTAEIRGREVSLAAAESKPVLRRADGAFGFSGAPDGFAIINHSGRIEANRVTIVSDGFLRNGGRILTEGPGNTVRLSGAHVTHELRPTGESVISTSDLKVEGEFRREGPVLNPDDGANPSVAGGLRRTPRLSAPGFLTSVTPGQTQLSHSPLQAARPSVSPMPPPRQASEVAANRGAAAPAPAKKGTVRKAAFFGQTMKR